MSTGLQTKQLFKGAFLLSLAGIISKILSAGYRIPLQNLTGDIGFYIYQQIYPIIGIALMLALYGFPAAISKLEAEQNAAGAILSLRSFYGPVLLILYAGNFLLFLTLFSQAELLAGWMGDNHLADTLRYASFIFLVIPLTAMVRGMFQGRYQMAPTATSQIIEQLARVIFILAVALYVASKADQYYLIGEAAVSGALTGTLAAFAFLSWRWRKTETIEKGFSSFSWKRYIKSILLVGIFLSCTQMMLLFIQFADTFTLVPGLVRHGVPLEEAKRWKGVLDRGQPLIQLGTVLGSSIALVLIPSITQSRLKDKPEKFYQHVRSAWKVSFVLSAGAAAGLISIFPYANQLLFQDDAGTGSLRILMIAILVTSLAITSASFLQGLGFVYQPGLYVIAGLVAKFLLNAIFVPAFGLSGGAWATVLSLSLVLLLNLFKLKKEAVGLSLRLIPGKAWLMSAGIMGLWIGIWQFGVIEKWELFSRLECLLYVLFISASGAALYLITFTKMNGFTEEELLSLPGGTFLMQLGIRRKR